MLLAGMVVPSAMAGGGSDPEHGDGGDLKAGFFWAYKDDATGSWGSASNYSSVEAAFNKAEITIAKDGTYDGPAKAQAALDGARKECEDGFDERHKDEKGHADCRVVAVGAGYVESTGHFNGTAIQSAQSWKKLWYDTAGNAANEYAYDGTYKYKTSTPFNDDSNMSVDKLVEKALVTDDVSIVVVVLDKYQPAPANYKLSVTTNQQSSDVKAGTATAVRDVIHASNNGSSIVENVDAEVILHYKGQAQGYMDARTVSKTVSITNNGDTTSPDFTPADFDWSLWADGTYWFDIHVAKQNKMAEAVDTTDEEPTETFNLASKRPPNPEKTITKGTSASQMTNTTTITTGTGEGAWEMTIKDIINPNGVNYSVDDFKIVDKSDNNRDLSGEFTMKWDKATNLVTAVRTSDKGVMPANHDVAFSFVVTVSKPDFSKIQDEGKVKWNKDDEVSTGSREFPTWRPNPDKAWIKWDEAANKWETVIDPEKTNSVGADSQTFLDGDKVGIAVNGTVAADLVKDQLTKLELTDDYSAADYIFDRDDVSQIRVYEVETATDKKTSVSDIVSKGKDVTSLYDIKVEGTKVTASAKAAHLKELTGMDKPKQVTLLIPGTANYANGSGAAQVRKDLGKAEAEEVAFCAVSGRSFTNSASQTVNDHEIRTNEPKICGYVPPNPKHVEAEASQGGDHEDIDGKIVFPGQKVEYTLTTQPTLPATLVYKIKTVGFVDAYDEYLTPDKQTLEVTDLSTGRPISKKQYTTKWDDANHKFTVTITDNINPNGVNYSVDDFKIVDI